MRLCWWHFLRLSLGNYNISPISQIEVSKSVSQLERSATCFRCVSFDKAIVSIPSVVVIVRCGKKRWVAVAFVGRGGGPSWNMFWTSCFSEPTLVYRLWGQFYLINSANWSCLVRRLLMERSRLLHSLQIHVTWGGAGKAEGGEDNDQRGFRVCANECKCKANSIEW